MTERIAFFWNACFYLYSYGNFFLKCQVDLVSNRYLYFPDYWLKPHHSRHDNAIAMRLKKGWDCKCGTHLGGVNNVIGQGLVFSVLPKYPSHCAERTVRGGPPVKFFRVDRFSPPQMSHHQTDQSSAYVSHFYNIAKTIKHQPALPAWSVSIFTVFGGMTSEFIL